MKEFLFQMWLALHKYDHFMMLPQPIIAPTPHFVPAETSIFSSLTNDTAPTDKIIEWFPHTFDRLVEKVEKKLITIQEFDILEVKKRDGALYLIPRKIIQQRDCEVA